MAKKVQISVSLDPTDIAGVEMYRRHRRLQRRPDAIRELIRKALEAEFPQLPLLPSLLGELGPPQLRTPDSS